MNIFRKGNCPSPLEHRFRGSGLLVLALVGAAVVSITSLTLAKANSVAVASLKGNSVALQAQQYADAEAQLIKATAYNELSAKSKADIQNSNGFQREVTLSVESDYSETIKEKTATVKVYRTGESTPRVTLNVKKYSQELQPSSGVPIGTIIAWPGSSAPSEGGTWLLCNGQSCAGYPALAAIVGSTVPNLNGRFLEGTTGTPRSFKDAGLPNITGAFSSYELGRFNAVVCEGAFGQKSSPVYRGSSNHSQNAAYFDFDASRCSTVYGSSDTVQPASYTVRYYIKAA